MCSTLKGNKTSPITRIIDPNATKGTNPIKTQPPDIDEVLRNIWGEISKDNLGPKAAASLGTTFLREYGQFLLTKNRPLSPTSLPTTFRRA